MSRDLTSPFTPGGELRCAACEMRVGSVTEPGCLVAIDMADDGETMSPACCPDMLEDAGKFCPVCGAPGEGCRACLLELRCDAA